MSTARHPHPTTTMPTHYPTLIALLMIGLAVPASASDLTYRGRAYDIDTGELLYIENHSETLRNGQPVRVDVTYTDATGRPMVEKVLHFATDLATPAFDLVDLRDGCREGATLDADGVVEFYTQRPGQSETRRRRLEMPKTPVIDAGFHRFMQHNLPRLMAGERMEVDFAVPSQRTFMRFQIERIADGAAAGEPGTARLAMKTANPLLRLLVDPLYLTYSASGKLLVYEGLSNIKDAAGDNHVARFVFDYDGPPARTTAQR